MKKVLFMLSSMNIGGVEKSLLSLLSIIPKDKYEVTVLLLEKKGDFLSYLPEWVTVEEALWFKKIKPIIMQPPQKTIRDFLTNKQYFQIITFVFSYFVSKYFNSRYLYYKQVFKSVPSNKNTYDIAIAYQGPTDSIDYYIANKIKATQKISWVHFDVSQHYVNTKLYAKLYKKFNRIYAVSNEAKHQLIEQIPGIKTKAKTFMNIVPAVLIKEMAEEKVHFDEAYRGLKIVTVGRLSMEKGQDMAIKALAKLKNEGIDVRWYCLGEGNSRKDYEQLINDYDLKDDFLLLGSSPNPYPYIKDADIYVQTSRHEGYCLTLAEAKCLFKPIITTCFTGANEQIKNGYNGMIIECNEDSLYKAAKELIDKPELRNKFSTNLKNNSESLTERTEKVPIF